MTTRPRTHTKRGHTRARKWSKEENFSRDSNEPTQSRLMQAKDGLRKLFRRDSMELIRQSHDIPHEPHDIPRKAARDAARESQR